MIIGVNKFVDEHEIKPKLERDASAEKDQVTRLKRYLETRTMSDPKQPWRTECEKLTEMADKGVTTGYCEQIKAALLAGATEGEIIKALQQVWGRYQPGI